jgi:exonuclease III
MRIATWNLGHAAKKFWPIKLQINQINQIAPDIIVITETCEEVDLSKSGYKVALPSKKNEYGKYWTGIWSKHQIISQPTTYDPETAVCAIIDSPIGKIMVYGTIIPYMNFKGSKGDSPPWYEHYKAIEDHGNDWEKLRLETGDKLPLFVAGDFNQTRDNSCRTYGTKFGRDLLSKKLCRNRLNCLTTENFGLTGKLNADPLTGRTRNNIDHICMTEMANKVRKVGAWDHFTESDTFMSDHNGVYFDVV